MKYLQIMTLFSIFLQMMSCAYIPKSTSNKKLLPFKQNPFNFNKLSLNNFSKKGTFQSSLYENFAITLSPTQSIQTDFYESKTKGKAPLVLILHGNKYNRKAHANQAHTFASWGIHCLTIDLPQSGQWLKNGILLKKLFNLVYELPETLSTSIDKHSIYIAGHSFGASASIVAIENNARPKGLILLDPALVHSSVINKMRNIKVPVIILGADKKVFSSKKRNTFFKNIPAPVSEISIIGATHTDAQNPSITKVHWGFDLFSHKNIQETYLSAFIASVFCFESSKGITLAWQIFQRELKHGRMKQNKIKF